MKLSPALALSLLTLSACGGGATGPSPAGPAAPAGKVVVWTGTAQRTMRTQFGPLDSTTTWEISNVTWVVDDGEVSGLAGGTIYKLASGHVKETIRQVAGPCVAVGDKEFDLKPGDGRLAVAGAGSYSGSITRRSGDEIRVIGDCGFGATGATLLDTLELPIDGANDTTRSASRLRGTKTEEIASSRHVSTWDFTASAWER